ncbi:hypothetical protein [Curtobacterium poinsettiae]|uniref:hypothetical protein n=1 Tax=Curtobacterium poinsettiae TaxID=159612 RepID=UPI0021C83C19|nr:hypothetical protein [Curtobacterium flaccumfaciens]MCU0113498.1 hypothetical protein [Curtobacterium flaccumfaciens]
MDTRLRPLRLDDAAAVLAAVITENADHLRPWEPSRAPSYFTESGQRDVITQALAAQRSGNAVPSSSSRPTGKSSAASR